MPACLVQRPQGTGDYLIMLFHDEALVGSAAATAEWQPAETLMLWGPRGGQYYGNPKARFSHSWMHCDGRRMKVLLEKAGLPVEVPLRLSNPTCFHQCLLDIYGERMETFSADPVIMGNLLENCLRTLARRLNAPGESTAGSEKLLAVRRLIESAPARTLTLDELAKMAGLSVPHFCYLFKKSFGIPPIEYLIEHRMSHAAYLLANRNLTVSEVAVACGYNDPYHFSRMFKKHFGKSPRMMRQNPDGLRSGRKGRPERSLDRRGTGC